ncbi:hypothetical protein COR50_07895 [Chitinophaga caeni]|uniref:Viral A-type inclusion protein n=1 Tax=Chitinophaga caeni TaxID=2029983 RepID=A0A291QTB9_9BACT|nr:hypothetical protein [Chitinophaga caeni]ATL47113.1 hypothetical protein COR50_07895 [Chitinophaga caeni]
MLRKKLGVLSTSTLAIGLLLSACQSGGNQAAEKSKIADSVKMLNKEVMEIHDAAMGKMITIRNLKQELGQNSDSLQKLKQPVPPTLLQAMNQLDSANAAMNTWMEEFDFDMEGKTDAEKLSYLKEELVKVTNVKLMMENSIEQAKPIEK